MEQLTNIIPLHSKIEKISDTYLMLFAKKIFYSHQKNVRQHCLQYLIKEKNYPLSLINVEKTKVYGRDKRYDIIVFTPQGEVIISRM